MVAGFSLGRGCGMVQTELSIRESRLNPPSNPLVFPVYPDDFPCPEFLIHKVCFPNVSKDYCDSFCFGSGCRLRDKCVSYNLRGADYEEVEVG